MLTLPQQQSMDIAIKGSAGRERLSPPLHKKPSSSSAEGAASLSSSDMPASTSSQQKQQEPPFDTSALAAEQELARGMSQLSVNELEQSLYDIHGVSELIEEPPQFVTQKLYDLDAALAVMDMTMKQSYNLAMQANPSYVQSEAFRLKFLRADTFDASAAAKRMARHLDAKLQLFGVQKLTKDLGMEDLFPEDLEVMESGWFTVLPLRDRAGRLVVVNIPPLRCGSAQSRTRFFFVLLSLLSKETDDQRKGIVGIGFHNQAKGRPELPVDPNLAQISGMIVASAPIKLCSVHGCEDKGGESAVKAFITKLDPQTRNRYKWHQVTKGDYNDLHFQLMSYGIPSQVLPLTKEGVYDLKYHHEFVKEQRSFEKEAARHTVLEETSIIMEPGPNDVKLGRQYLCKTHHGNLKYLDMVHSHLEEYDALHRFERRKILVKIYNAVKESGGRFVKRTESGEGWIEISFETAIDKIANAFRTKRKTNKTSSLLRQPEPEATLSLSASNLAGNTADEKRPNKRALQDDDEPENL
jgi:hypothetical protein